MTFEEMYGGQRPAQDLRYLLAIAVRHLGGAVQFQDIALGIVARNRAPSLQGNARVAPDRDVKRHDGVRGGKERRACNPRRVPARRLPLSNAARFERDPRQQGQFRLS